MFNDFSYQPTDLNDELFLSEAPLELLMESLQTQFDDPYEYRKIDYIQSFYQKYNFSKENLFEDDLIMLEQCYDTFISFIENLFQEYLSIGIPEIEDMGEEDLYDLIHLTYRFFIKNIKKNFTAVILNYIESHKDEIEENYNGVRKDVTTLAFKAEIDDAFDVLVLSNLEGIINDALKFASGKDSEVQDYDVDNFFSLCEWEEPSLECEYVKQAFDDLKLTGNFVSHYVDMVDSVLKSELKSKIRNRILKKYGKRTVNIEIDEELDNIDDENIDDTEEENVEE